MTAEKRDSSMTHVQEIHDERKRQVDVEGWTPEHDDAHDDAQMLRAAVLYYHHATRPADWPLAMRADGAPVGWPWEAAGWKPKDPRRTLIVAGALCLAERERIYRRYGRMTQGFAYLGTTNPNRACVGHVDQKLQLIIDALKRHDG
jgi:hypothetical protein